MEKLIPASRVLLLFRKPSSTTRETRWERYRPYSLLYWNQGENIKFSLQLYLNQVIEYIILNTSSIHSIN